MKAGAGRAARYVNGKMPINTKNSSRKEQSSNKSKAATGANALAQMSSAMTEEQRMAAMFAAQTEQWTAQQEEMAQ
jgi:protein MPE1